MVQSKDGPAAPGPPAQRSAGPFVPTSQGSKINRITMTIEDKLNQLYAALREMNVSANMSSIKPQFRRVRDKNVAVYDLNQGTDSATAANRVSLLLHNIACLKDHLNAWCEKNGKQEKPTVGDKLINGNKDVAIIHDLWNLDKHAELKHPSRSGLYPKLQGPPKAAFNITRSQVVFSLRMVNGVMQGTGDLRITAMVVDKDGNQLGNLESIALRAVAAWEAEFNKVGMKLTPPPDRQKEYGRLSGMLQGIGMRFKSEFPNGTTSLLMKTTDGKVTVEAYDRTGQKIGDIPNDKTSPALRESLQRTFEHQVSPDHDGVTAILAV
jgi:hypothetical protein